MTFAFHGESVIPLNASAKHFPARPSVRTIWRWATQGVRGVQLQTFVSGNKRFTSLEAIARFIEAQNNRCKPLDEANDCNLSRHAAAESAAERAGL